MALPKIVECALFEFIAMAIFVFVGCGTACTISITGGWHILVALAFGLAITVLVYTIGHRSGGHVNCAVTIALMISQDCDPLEGLAIIVAQFLGSITGAGILSAAVPKNMDNTGGLGANGISAGYSWANAFVAEVFMTYLLLFVIYETAVNPASLARSNANNRPNLAPVAIGFAVFLAHACMLGIDGCSINLTRSFGPAIMASTRGAEEPFKNFEVFMIGPIIGAIIASLQYRFTRPGADCAPAEPTKADE